MGKPVVTVVGLGPGAKEYLTAENKDIILKAKCAYLRTERHPSAQEFAIAGIKSFDYVYENADEISEVYETIAQIMIEKAIEYGSSVLAVPGSPFVGETTLGILKKSDQIHVKSAPAASFVDLIYDRLGLDPVEESVKLVNADSFKSQIAGYSGAVIISGCWTKEHLSEIKLAAGDSLDEYGFILKDLSLPTEEVKKVKLEDLDRATEPNHLTSVYLPEFSNPYLGELADLMDIIETLRTKCPWDKEQTHKSIKGNLIEESYEVLDAIEKVPENHEALLEELGDLLFQILFHVELAKESGQFDLKDVVVNQKEKLISRHPHVFGDIKINSAEEVLRRWEEFKAADKKSTVSENIARSLPSLLLLKSVYQKAKYLNFEGFENILEDMQAKDLAKIATKLIENRINPELALRDVALKFISALEDFEIKNK